MGLDVFASGGNEIVSAAKALKKKNSYISNNFIVGDNLIETYESQSCPLDTRNVEKIIKTFLV